MNRLINRRSSITTRNLLRIPMKHPNQQLPRNPNTPRRNIRSPTISITTTITTRISSRTFTISINIRLTNGNHRIQQARHTRVRVTSTTPPTNISTHAIKLRPITMTRQLITLNQSQSRSNPIQPNSTTTRLRRRLLSNTLPGHSLSITQNHRQPTISHSSRITLTHVSTKLHRQQSLQKRFKINTMSPHSASTTINNLRPHTRPNQHQNIQVQTRITKPRLQIRRTRLTSRLHRRIIRFTTLNSTHSRQHMLHTHHVPISTTRHQVRKRNPIRTPHFIRRLTPLRIKLSHRQPIARTRNNLNRIIKRLITNQRSRRITSQYNLQSLPTNTRRRRPFTVNQRHVTNRIINSNLQLTQIIQSHPHRRLQPHIQHIHTVRSRRPLTINHGLQMITQVSQRLRRPPHGTIRRRHQRIPHEVLTTPKQHTALQSHLTITNAAITKHIQKHRLITQLRQRTHFQLRNRHMSTHSPIRRQPRITITPQTTKHKLRITIQRRMRPPAIQQRNQHVKLMTITNSHHLTTTQRLRRSSLITRHTQIQPHRNRPTQIFQPHRPITHVITHMKQLISRPITPNLRVRRRRTSRLILIHRRPTIKQKGRTPTIRNTIIHRTPTTQNTIHQRHPSLTTPINISSHVSHTSITQHTHFTRPHHLQHNRISTARQPRSYNHSTTAHQRSRTQTVVHRHSPTRRIRQITSRTLTALLRITQRPSQRRTILTTNRVRRTRINTILMSSTTPISNQYTSLRVSIPNRHTHIAHYISHSRIRNTVSI